MRDQKSTTKLPEHLGKYFWDYAADELNWEHNRHTIVLRLLQSGGMDAIRWLRARMSDEEIRNVLIRGQGRGIEPRRLRFWGLVLDIPRAEVDRWIRAASANPWNRRTH